MCRSGIAIIPGARWPGRACRCGGDTKQRRHRFLCV